MCGITGYVGPRDAYPILVGGLERLEYRGYDSAGIATIGADRQWNRRAARGRQTRVTCAVPSRKRRCTEESESAIRDGQRTAVLRRATRIRTRRGRVAVIHNGIIENYVELRAALIRAATSSAPRPTPNSSHI
jgi:glucosamine--fructose-6-phosphate aminotransferase (isomerizing)